MPQNCKHCGSEPCIENQRENVWSAYCTSLDCPNPPFITGSSMKEATDKWDAANKVEDDPRKAQALAWLELNKQMAQWQGASAEHLSMFDYLIEVIK